MAKKTSWIIPVEEDENGDVVIGFPEDALTQVGWKPGDRLKWIKNKDRSWTLTKDSGTQEEEDDDSGDDVFKNEHRDKDAGESSITATVTREAIEQVHQLMQVTDMDTVDVVMSRSSGIGLTVLFRFRGTIDGTDYSTW